MEKIIGYIRYSSHAQDDGNSVAAQTTCIEQYATAHDMEIEKFYMDTAKSGRFTENRPEYNRMKEEIQNGTIQAKTIVVERWIGCTEMRHTSWKTLPFLKNRTFV